VLDATLLACGSMVPTLLLCAVFRATHGKTAHT
jgi:hypothetical protein